MDVLVEEWRVEGPVQPVEAEVLHQQKEGEMVQDLIPNNYICGIR